MERMNEKNKPTRPAAATAKATATATATAYQKHISSCDTKNGY